MSHTFTPEQIEAARVALREAGVSERDIDGGGLTGALRLASAGSLDIDAAAKRAAQALRIVEP